MKIKRPRTTLWLTVERGKRLSSAKARDNQTAATPNDSLCHECEWRLFKLVGAGFGNFSFTLHCPAWLDCCGHNVTRQRHWLELVEDKGHLKTWFSLRRVLHFCKWARASIRPLAWGECSKEMLVSTHWESQSASVVWSDALPQWWGWTNVDLCEAFVGWQPSVNRLGQWTPRQKQL